MTAHKLPLSIFRRKDSISTPNLSLPAKNHALWNIIGFEDKCEKP
jgi:hypothetical protein